MILLLGAVGLAAYWHLNREEAGPGILTLYGNVEIRDLSLGFRVGGRISEMRLEEGDQVRSGELLAALDRGPYQDQVNLSEARVREAEASLENAEKNLARVRSLFQKGSSTESDYDAALAQRDVLAASLDTAKAQLAISRTSLEDTSLFSPSAGTVLTRVREPGEIVGAGETVYGVSLDDPVWVRAYVDEPDLGRIGPGRTALIATDMGRVYRGQVGFVSPKAEFTPKSVETAMLRTELVYRLRIVVENADGSLRQGMPVTVTFP